jgi:hypothetical protein
MLNRRMAQYTVKKVNDFPVPSRDVTNQTLPGRESLVSDIPAVGGKIANLFHSVFYIEENEYQVHRTEVKNDPFICSHF